LGSVGVGARGEGTPLNEMFLLWASFAVRGDDDRDINGLCDCTGGFTLDGPERGSGGKPKDQLFVCWGFPDGVDVGAGGRGELA